MVFGKLDSRLNIRRASNLGDVVRDEALCAGYTGIVVDIAVTITVLPGWLFVLNLKLSKKTDNAYRRQSIHLVALISKIRYKFTLDEAYLKSYITNLVQFW